MKRPRGTHAGIDWSAQPLGQMTDAALARRLGVCRRAVEKARTRRGIARFIRPRKPRTQGLFTQTDWSMWPLGGMFDSQLARLVGVSQAAVWSARERKGIPPYSEERTCACGQLFVTSDDRVHSCSLECASTLSGFKRYHAGKYDDLAPVAVALAALKRAVRHADRRQMRAVPVRGQQPRRKHNGE